MNATSGMADRAGFALAVLCTGWLVFNMVALSIFKDQVFLERGQISTGGELAILIGFVLVLVFNIVSLIWVSSRIRKAQIGRKGDIGLSALGALCLILMAGADPDKLALFDTKGGLHKKRDDIKADAAYYRKWELCEKTNPDCLNSIAEGMKGADVLIALSTPGPDVIKPEWIRTMAPKAIVFACANPVPEIYPYAAKEAGAYIVATGRGDFPNQVNNSMGFPGILKGALLVRARKITDEMAIAAAYSVANFAEKKGITPDYIMPTMSETEVFAEEAADVAMTAIANGVARITPTRDEVYAKTLAEIKEARSVIDLLMREKHIAAPDPQMLANAVEKAVALVTK